MDQETLVREINEAARLLSEGNAELAEAILERLHEAHPHDRTVAINLGGAYILRGRFKQAVPLLEAVVAQEENNAMAWTNLAAAYLGNPVLATSEQQDRAIAAFERALACDPAAPNVAYNIGLIYRDRGDRELAIDWFNRALQANPNDRDARRVLDRLLKAG